MMGGGSADQRCWDCDLPGHRRGDSACRSAGECNGSQCPSFLKQLKADGKDTTPKPSGGGGRDNGKRKGGGGVQEICNFFARKRSFSD